jgi:hypothetical protein
VNDKMRTSSNLLVIRLFAARAAFISPFAGAYRYLKTETAFLPIARKVRPAP